MGVRDILEEWGANVVDDRMDGTYTLGRRLGAGGMGVVFEAVSWETGATVAIKFLHPGLRQDADALRQFSDEAIAASIVCHPNLVEVLEVGETRDGEPFLVMERFRGEPLGLEIARRGPWSPHRSIALLRQVLGAVHELHATGVVHGDLKSDNILVRATDDGADVAKVIDFGLARVQFSDDATQYISPDVCWLLGTPEYMAPEVFQGEAVSFASDQYALGVVLYELLTGDTPFSGGTNLDIARRHLEDAVVPPSLRRPDDLGMRTLDGIVVRAMSKDPAARFASIDDLSRALARAVERVRPHDPTMPSRSRTRTARRDEIPTEVYARSSVRRRRLASSATQA